MAEGSKWTPYLEKMGEQIYQQAPHEAIRGGDDELTWGDLTEAYQNVDYTSLNEEEDNTKLKQVLACAGGTCDLNLDV